MFCVPFLLQQALQERVEFFLCGLRYKMIPTNDFLGAIVCYFLFFFNPKNVFSAKSGEKNIDPSKKKMIISFV
jgi:hypothetical protein